MRIRKRSQSVAATTPLPQQQQPISCKYQTPPSPPPGLRGRFQGSKGAAECSNMQATRCSLEPDQDHDERPRFDMNATPSETETLRLSDAHVNEDLSDSPRLEDTIPEKGRQRQSSPKRRKIEHEPSLQLFEGSASMTAAELLVVNELANGVRQRLHAASEHSTTTEVTKTLPPKPVENSKDALISSIFFVFGTCGENGLSASEVVKYMLEQRLPGLKEGGARHTVQVANVLRSSSSFISLGDKKYLLCSSLDTVSRPSEPGSKKPTAGTSSRQPHKPSPARSSPGSPGLDSSENEDVSPQQKPRIRARSEKTPHSSATRSGTKGTQPGTSQPDAKPKLPVTLQDGEPELPVVVKTTRRRGPSSSQKGKGPTQCKRYDGRGWQCSRLTEPGYSLCVHHQDLINKRAAKLKEQQTLSRLMESQQRKLAKSQQQQQHQQPPPLVETPKVVTDSKVTENGNAAMKQSIRDRESTNPGAHVQKRKMLSLLAIK